MTNRQTNGRNQKIQKNEFTIRWRCGKRTRKYLSKEERYHKLVTRQSEIEEQLDLTKNQAPSQVESIAADDTEEEKNTEKQNSTKDIRSKQQVAVRI
jgi:hypothetical protein